jgi:hypothetical protein
MMAPTLQLHTHTLQKPRPETKQAAAALQRRCLGEFRLPSSPIVVIHNLNDTGCQSSGPNRWWDATALYPSLPPLGSPAAPHPLPIRV